MTICDDLLAAYRTSGGGGKDEGEGLRWWVSGTIAINVSSRIEPSGAGRRRELD